MSFFRLAARANVLPRQAWRFQAPQPSRLFRAPLSASAVLRLNRSDIETRVGTVLRSFEKADLATLEAKPSATFTELGLDSLDAVEVVMAIEEEFSIEIPDAEADELQTVKQAIEYIAQTPAAA